MLFRSNCTFSQITRGSKNNSENQQEEEKTKTEPLDSRFKEKKKVADCNKDLELEQANNLIYHKRTRKPYTGSCVSYYDNQQMERMASFILGKEHGTSYSYYKNGQVRSEERRVGKECRSRWSPYH